LEYLGHNKVNIINGGLSAWVAAGGQLTTEVISPLQTQYQAKLREDIVVDKEHVVAHLNYPNTILVDARGSSDIFRGEQKLDNVLRDGHIPGAVHVPWHQNVDIQSGKWKSAEDLLKMYEREGVTKDKEVIIYDECLWVGTINYFSLRLLGYPKVKAYDGSWNEWGNDLWLPIESVKPIPEWDKYWMEGS
jgi:thiosulfate/3-mercaptopyruvate sulfurtransferase